MADKVNEIGDAAICLLGFIIGAATASWLIDFRSEDNQSTDRIEWLFDNSEAMSRHLEKSPGKQQGQTEAEK